MNESTATDRCLADALPEGVIILTDHYHVEWYNQRAKQLLRLPETPQHQSITSLLPTLDINDLSTQAIYDFYTSGPNQARRCLSLRLLPYRAQRQLLMVQDVTHTRHLEGMRRDFIANVSHELRTPLTVLHGYLEILQTQDTVDSNMLSDILPMMHTQSERMGKLVQDLLLLSRLEGHLPNTEDHSHVDVSSLLNNICADAKKLSGEKQHKFILQVDQDLTLQGKSDELHSAFSNLIYNAVHYTPPHGTITVNWFCDQQGKKMQVQDTGIGITEEHLPKITQRFYRVDKARSSQAGGTGLGLAIVKHVLLRHQGELLISSEPNQGSTFCCVFPL